jgi:hypothetical protein
MNNSRVLVKSDDVWAYWSKWLTLFSAITLLPCAALMCLVSPAFILVPLAALIAGALPFIVVAIFEV